MIKFNSKKIFIIFSLISCLIIFFSCDRSDSGSFDNNPVNSKLIITPGPHDDQTASDNTPDSFSFDPDDADIIYKISDGGIIDGQTAWKLNLNESTGTVIAVPDEDHYFLRWSDGLEAPERSDVFNGSKQVFTAEFAEKIVVRLFSEPSDAAFFENGSYFRLIPGESANISVSANSGYEFSGWKDGLIEQNFSISPSENTDLTAIFTMIPSIPDIYINTDGGTPVTSKDTYLSATVSVNDLTEKLSIDGAECAVKGHGNSTWEYFSGSKPSYRLKLTEKLSLAGVGALPGKDFVLISNHADATMLRNYTILSLARRFENIHYVTDFRYVNLYLNGKPMGLYLLTEKVKVSKNRINIDVDETGAETDTGYLLELDLRAPEENKDVYFYIDGTSYTIAIKSDGSSPSQKNYISDYINDFYKACKSGNREKVAEYADIPSIIDMFILEEFSRERDAGFSSFYMIKEKGKVLRFDCPWDFDLSLGGDNMYRSTSGLVTESNERQNLPNPFFAALYKCEWFRSELSKRFIELKPVIRKMIDDVMDEAEFLREANDANNKIWQVYGRRLMWEPERVIELQNYDEHIAYLKDWMLTRLSWLEGKLVI